MYKIVRKTESIARKISDNKTVNNFITKEISPNFSLAVINNKGYFGEVNIKNDRIYYVISGELMLTFDNEEIRLDEGDACFISSNSSYIMSGDCKIVTVDQPAFETK